MKVHTSHQRSRFSVEEISNQKEKLIKNETSLFLECDHCQKKFPRKANLNTNLKQQRQSNFSKSFSQENYFSSCNEKAHRNQIFECSLCQYKSNKRPLKNHQIRLHTSNFNFACEICRKQFKII